jgi:tRNA nucleotidyltransferase (CCA-adding enzyme)
MTKRIYRADEFVGSLGVEAYRVGGSVRDEIIGRPPKDADYIVRGVSLRRLADAMKFAGASNVSPIVARDKAHLGYRAAIRGIGLIEVVLPRTERSTGSGRDMEITVDPELSLAEDAKRRDFTFNALYKGVTPGYPQGAIEGGVIDPTGNGLNDLQRRIIRVTHGHSFIDDPLRMLRALRFVSTLDADIDPGTRYLMVQDAAKTDGLCSTWVEPKTCKCAPGCEHEKALLRGGGVSGTVLEEFSKLLMGQAPAKALRIARDTGVLAVALPELASILGHDPESRYHDLPTDEHTFKALETAAHVNASLRVRWALLFHDSGKPDVEWVGEDGRKHFYARSDEERDHEVASAERWRKAAKRLGAGKHLTKDVNTLILHHMVPVKTRNPGGRVRRMRVQFGDDLLRDLLLHRTCDLSGKGSKVALNHIEHIAKMERLRREAFEANVPADVTDLEINGKDCLEAGHAPRWIRTTLSVILDDVVSQPDAQKLSREWQYEQMRKRVAWSQGVERACQK